MKSKHIQDPPTVSIRLAPPTVAALRTLRTALGDPTEESVAIRALSIGLFVLGLDPGGDYPLAQVTDALFGKDSEDAAGVFNSIVDAGGNAQDTRHNSDRSRRERELAAVGGAS